MGRQIALYMLRNDTVSFLQFVQSRDPVVVTLRSAGEAELRPVADPAEERDVMILWHTALAPALTRTLVKDRDGRSYYRVPSSAPALEFIPSRRVEWEGLPALVSGRVYGSNFDTSGPDYAEWYESLARWVRRRFSRSPVRAVSGYIGPSALEWFTAGGIFLPGFKPPRTAEWLKLIDSQHAKSS